VLIALVVSGAMAWKLRGGENDFYMVMGAQVVGQRNQLLVFLDIEKRRAASTPLRSPNSTRVDRFGSLVILNADGQLSAQRIPSGVLVHPFVSHAFMNHAGVYMVYVDVDDKHGGYHVCKWQEGQCVQGAQVAAGLPDHVVDAIAVWAKSVGTGSGADARGLDAITVEDGGEWICGGNYPMSMLCHWNDDFLRLTFLDDGRIEVLRSDRRDGPFVTGPALSVVPVSRPGFSH
jgi:hypothetical protein